MNNNDIVSSFIEVKLKEKNDFLKIKETLERIGIASKKNKTLYQSCHILHKQGKYYIVHFKELYALDGKETDFTEEDKARRNTIANLLKDWGLFELVDFKKSEEPKAPMTYIKVIPFKDKKDWNLEAKYNIGLYK